MNGGSPPVVVSTIIVSWNARRYLLGCLASLSPDVCRFPMEIIVVDNASSDGSAESVASQYPQVRLIRNDTNVGFAGANNMGMAAATGRYLCLINSDVKVLRNCISTLVDYCDQHPRVGLVGPRVLGADGDLQHSCRGVPTLWSALARALALDVVVLKMRRLSIAAGAHRTPEATRPVDILSGCFWLVRKAALPQVGLLVESFFMYGEDMDWCRRFWSSGWKVVHVSSAEAVHYGGASSSNAPVRFYIEKQRADLQYWKKHRSRPAVACYSLIALLHEVLRAIGYTLADGLGRRGDHPYRSKVERSRACLMWMLTGRFPVPTTP